jgi:hypothetical protein
MVSATISIFPAIGAAIWSDYSAAPDDGVISQKSYQIISKENERGTPK